MAKPIGKTFVEIEIDAKKYNKGVIDVKTTTKKKLSEIEKAWKGLGKKSEATYDQMRASVNKNYDKIKTHALSTADDILRAEKAKNEKIARINKQQFGDQKSLIDKAKEHWVALSIAAVAAITAITTAVTFVIKTIKQWVDLAAKQELAEVNLAAALKASGEFTDALNMKYQTFASSIQTVTKYGDEQVLTLMALMKNLGVTTDRLEEATKMAIGLATATGRDVQSMAMYIALAEQGEFTMLRRYIPALRSTTDATEQMKIITDFAARGFKVAQEQTASYAIGMTQLGNLYGDLKEKLGDFIIKNEVVLELMQRTRKWLTEVGKGVEAWRKANQELINQKTEEVFLVLAGALKIMAEASKDVLIFLGKLLEVGKKLSDVWEKIPESLKKAFSVVTLLAMSKHYDLTKELMIIYEKLGDAAESNIVKMKIIKDVTDSTNKTTDAVKNLTKGIAAAKKETDLWATFFGASMEKSSEDASSAASKFTKEWLGGFDRMMTKVDLWTKIFHEKLKEQRRIIKEIYPEIEEEVTGVYDTMVAETDSTTKKMIKAFKGYAGDVIDFVSNVASSAQNIASKVSSVISEIWSGLKSVMGMVGGVITFFITFPGDLQESLERFAKSIKELPGIIEEFFVAANIFSDNLPEIITTFIDSVGVFIDGIVAALPGVVDALITELPRLVDAFIEALPIVMDALIAGAEKFTLAIVEEIPRLIEAIMAEIPGMVTSFMEVFLPAILDMIPKVIEAILQGIPDIIKALSAGIPTVVTSLIDAIVDLIPILVEEMPVIVEALTTAMMEDSPRIIDALIEGVPRIVEALVKAIGRKITPSAFDFTGGYDVPSLSEIVDIAWPFHKGGIVGQESQTSRFVSAAAFTTAPRAHTGFMPNEVPIIAKRGEGVFTPEQMAALGGVNINSPLINIGGNLIADKQTFNDFAEQIDYAISKRSKRVYAQ